MALNSRLFVFACLVMFSDDALGQQAPSPDEPANVEVIAPGVSLTLVAEHPQLVTPTGIDVDRQGRIWCVSVHTHFRPEEYDGPEHDEVLVFADTDGDSTFDHRTVFYNRTDATMDLELGEDGWVYLAERDRILRVKDLDGDGVGDVEENIAVLDTKADYPHNAMAGIAWHPSGDLMFSLGENFAQPWSLSGTDGATITGTGEGGIFRCSADGTKLRRVARGFWNPFGLCVRDDGEMFAAENDPGASPPCRLLHIVEGGDYGYQRLYGPDAYHPFVRWNGGLRGVLPMIHPTGEAPCAVQPLGKGLLVPTWTDHRIDFYDLIPRGASFGAERTILVQGGNNFRPVCVTPPIHRDGRIIFYFTDWVFVSYELHQRGRLWRLEIDPEQADWLHGDSPSRKNDSHALAQQLRTDPTSFELEHLFEHADSSDPFLSVAALNAIALNKSLTIQSLPKLSAKERANAVVAISYRFDPSGAPLDDTAITERAQIIEALLKDDSPEVLFETLRWIGDDNLTQFAPQVRQISTRSELTFELFEACVATINTLAGRPADGVRNVEALIARVNDSSSSPRLRAYALRLLPRMPTVAKPDQAVPITEIPSQLTMTLFRELLNVGDAELTREVIATLAGDPLKADIQQLLIEIADDDATLAQHRADAIAALAPVATDHTETLLRLAESAEAVIVEEALRALRQLPFTIEQRSRLEGISKRSQRSIELVNAILDPDSLKNSRPPSDQIVVWQQRLRDLPTPPDVEAGRRIFFHSKVAQCSRCHRHSGRGSMVGPDLSELSVTGDPDLFLLESILQPSLKVAPEYRARSLLLADGKTFTGIHLRTGGGSDVETLRDSNGQERRFPRVEIVASREATSSLMPDGQALLLTNRELRDLIAFLKNSSANSSQQSARN